MSSLWRRTFRVLADEGLAGFTTRGRRFANRSEQAERSAQAKRELTKRQTEFAAQSHRLGQGDLSRHYWYHTIDLGQGIITPGDYDYRALVSAYQFPADMRGMTVLDVGSSTGFFAFEFERRGATVVSVELPSIEDWDIPAVDKPHIIQDLYALNKVSTIAELNRVLVHGPFDVCAKALGSKVTRCYSRIYDLTPANVGHAQFDLIFCGDMLLHTFAPLAGLAVLAPLCKGTLMVAQELALLNPEQPLMQYMGGSGRGRNDNRTWWLCNQLCLEQMLHRVGFTDVQAIAVLPAHADGGGAWWTENHTVFRATKT